MLAGLAVEEDFPMASDVNDGVVAEVHRADNTGVELGEDLAVP